MPFYSPSDSDWETESSFSSDSEEWESITGEVWYCRSCHVRCMKEMDLEAQEETFGVGGQKDRCCGCYDVGVTMLFMLLVFLMACGFVWVLKH